MCARNGGAIPRSLDNSRLMFIILFSNTSPTRITQPINKAAPVCKSQRGSFARLFSHIDSTIAQGKWRIIPSPVSFNMFQSKKPAHIRQ